MRHRAREISYTAVAVTAMAVVLVLIGLWVRMGNTVDAIRETQKSGSPLLVAMAGQQDQIAKLAHRIQSCTTPKGECYRRSQARTDDLVGIPPGPLNTVTVLAASCAAGLADLPLAERIRQTTDCVTAQLKIAANR